MGKDKMWIFEVGANCGMICIDKVVIFAPNRWKAWQMFKTECKSWVYVAKMRRATAKEETEWPKTIL